jgi:serine/threonine protein kinase
VQDALGFVVSTQSRGDDPTLVTGGPPCADPVLTRGSTVGRYVVLEPIGRGAHGTVFLAADPELDRHVALKILVDDGREPVAGTLEAQLLAKLSHPNIVAVYDVGRVDDVTFIAMEYVRGSTLRRWLTQRVRSTDEILEVFDAAGRGVVAAHDAGIVHRDFKPDNVLVGQDGTVRVVDFGIAHHGASADDTSGRHDFRGTPA